MRIPQIKNPTPEQAVSVALLYVEPIVKAWLMANSDRQGSKRIGRMYDDAVTLAYSLLLEPRVPT